MKHLGLVVLLSLTGLLSACNTVEGVGRDVSKAGSAVTNAARDVSDKL